MDINNFNIFLKKEKIILIICFFIFIISATYAFYFKINPAVDARVYDTVAKNIIDGKGFRFDLEKPLIQDDVITYQGPFYQYFLAAIYFIFGHHYEIVWLIQSLIRALSAFFLFLICRNIFNKEGEKIGWIASIIFGFYPDLIEINAMLMSETIYIFFNILVIYTFFLYCDRKETKNIFLLGLFSGITILIRSTAAGIFIPIFLFYFLRNKKWKHLFLFILLICLILTPWTIRNYLVYHSFIPTMANAGYNLWTGNYEGGDGEGGNVPQHFEIMEKYGVIEANNYGITQFKNFVLNHPLVYIKLTATRFIKYFSFIRPMGFWFYQKGIGQLIFVFSSALASVFLFTFGFAGIFSFFKKEKEKIKLIYLFLFAFLTCISITFILIETRYRLPIYPFMAIFSGFFITRLFSFEREYLGYLFLSFSILLLISIFNVFLEYNKIFEKLNQFFV